MHFRKPKKNFLDMVPVRSIKEFTDEDGKITLLIPRFKSKWMLKWLVPSGRSQYLRVHLDEMGSKVWHLIDGERNTEEICNDLGQFLQEKDNSNSNAELRVTEFLRRLYRNRYIVFKQS